MRRRHILERNSPHKLVHTTATSGPSVGQVSILFEHFTTPSRASRTISHGSPLTTTSSRRVQRWQRSALLGSASPSSCAVSFTLFDTEDVSGSRTLVYTVPALFAQGERAHGCYASSSTRTMMSHRWIPVDYHVALGLFPKSCEEVQDLRRSRWLQGSCTIVRLRGRFPEFLNQDVGRFVSLHSDACPTDSVHRESRS